MNENRHDPYFGPAVYIVRDIMEDANIGTTVFRGKQFKYVYPLFIKCTF